MKLIETLIVIGSCVAFLALKIRAAPVDLEDGATLDVPKAEGTPPVNSESDEIVSKSSGNLNLKSFGIVDHRVVGSEVGSRSKRYALYASKWDHNNLTYKISEWPSGLDKKLVADDIACALAAWSEHSGLTFTPKSGKVDIEVKFLRGDHGDGYPFDGREHWMAHAFLPGSEEMRGQIHFDDDYKWTVKNGKRQVDRTSSIFDVAVHEFGHTLGLLHSPIKKSLMYPWYESSDFYSALTKDDIAGIQELYGRNTGARDPSVCRTHPRDKDDVEVKPVQPEVSKAEFRAKLRSLFLRIKALLFPWIP